MFSWSHLQRSGSVRFFPAEVNLSSDGQTHEEPVAEAVVVDELEDVLHCQVDQGHDTLHSGQSIERRTKGERKKVLNIMIFII